MWKFVTRRFKDTVERTYNVLDVRQTWTCGFDSKKDTKSSVSSTVVANAETRPESFDSLRLWRCEDFKYNKRKSSQNHQYFHDDFYRRINSATETIISNAFLTTATLLSGFYFSQAIILGRRRHNLRHLDSKFNLRLFENPNHQLRTSFGRKCCLLIWAKSVFEKSFVPSYEKQTKLGYNDVNFGTFSRPIPVNNDHTKEEVENDANAGDDHVLEAINTLMETLGHIEFKLGLQNIQANEHKVAVSHFKLATTHRHAGATFNLGVCYELGIGINKNMKSAMECYRAAAALGHKKAMYNLGVFYARGEGGLTKNRKAAAACLLAADKLGLQSARTVFDVPKDMRKPDDEINFKTTKTIEDVYELHQRSHLFG